MLYLYHNKGGCHAFFQENVFMICPQCDARLRLSFLQRLVRRIKCRECGKSLKTIHTARYPLKRIFVAAFLFTLAVLYLYKGYILRPSMLPKLGLEMANANYAIEASNISWNAFLVGYLLLFLTSAASRWVGVVGVGIHPIEFKAKKRPELRFKQARIAVVGALLAPFIFGIWGENKDFSLTWSVLKDQDLISKSLLAIGADANGPSILPTFPLLIAMEQNDQDMISHLLAKGAKVNSRTHLMSPLRMAIISQNIETLKLLVSQGADINFPSQMDQSTALFDAIYDSDKDPGILDLLLIHGANVNYVNKFGHTPLTLAAAYGKNLAVKRMIEKGANIDWEINDGFTALMLAAKNNHEEIAKLLIERGARLDVKARNGTTALLAAAKSGMQSLMLGLLAKGASARVLDKKTGWSPLHYLIDATDSANAVKPLLFASAPVNGIDVRNRTPLHLAAEKNRVEIARVLINNGADIHARAISPAARRIKIASDWDYTPLHYSAYSGSAGVARLLLEMGEDINIKSDEGATPLIMAALKDRFNIASLFLKKGADINARVINGETALFVAAKYASAKLVGLLIRSGANINAITIKKFTPLFPAVWKGKIDNVSLLIANGAKVNVADYQGWTPLHFASKEANVAMVKLLIENGADPNAKNREELTPLAYLNLRMESISKKEKDPADFQRLQQTIDLLKQYAPKE